MCSWSSWSFGFFWSLISSWISTFDTRPSLEPDCGDHVWVWKEESDWFVYNKSEKTFCFFCCEIIKFIIKFHTSVTQETTMVLLDQENQYRCFRFDTGPGEPVQVLLERRRGLGGRGRRLLSDEDDRLPVFWNPLSLSLLQRSQCRPSVRAPPSDGCVQLEMGGVVMHGRVQSYMGGVTQLSVSFQDAQTALQQLQVPLQVRGAGSETQAYRWTTWPVHKHFYDRKNIRDVCKHLVYFCASKLQWSDSGIRNTWRRTQSSTNTTCFRCWSWSLSSQDQRFLLIEWCVFL